MISCLNKQQNLKEPVERVLCSTEDSTGDEDEGDEEEGDEEEELNSLKTRHSLKAPFTKTIK